MITLLNETMKELNDQLVDLLMSKGLPPTDHFKICVEPDSNIHEVEILLIEKVDSFAFSRDMSLNELKTEVEKKFGGHLDKWIERLLAPL